MRFALPVGGAHIVVAPGLMLTVGVVFTFTVIVAGALPHPTVVPVTV